MTLVTVSQHLGLLWVAVEATTLASAPLIFFHRHHRSLEATWKYLLICSVGIAVALLGNFFLAMAATAGGAGSGSMVVSELLAGAASFHTRWLKAAFVLMLVGYGTKMGLAPLHTWLPDAHAESPSVVSALLSGALLNCAFLAVLRGYQVLVPAGLGEFGGSLLVLLGLVSMACRGRLHRRPDRLQAHAGLLVGRAHGDPGARRRPRWRRRLRRPAARGESLAHQGRCCSSSPATSSPPTRASRPARYAASPGGCRSPACCGSRGFSRSPARRRSGLS